MTLELSLRTKRFSMQAMREAVERITSGKAKNQIAVQVGVGQVQLEVVKVESKPNITVVPGPDYDYGPT